jgi:sugar phosphate isomerase/epimerase
VTYLIRESADGLKGPRPTVSVVLSQAFPDLAEQDIPEVVRRALGDFGFGAVELVAVSDPRIRRQLRTVVENAGAAVICLGGLPLLAAGLTLSGDDDTRAAAVALACDLVESAIDLGAQALLVTSGPDVNGTDRALARTRLTRSLIEIGEYAGQRGAGLMVRLEPTDQTVRHRQLVGPTSEALEVVSRAREEVSNVDLNLDLSHLLQLGEDPLHEFRRSRASCRHVHLSNCVLRDRHSPLYGEQHPPFGIAGSEVGVHQLAVVLRTLAEAGYLAAEEPATLGLEVVPPPGSEPWKVLEQACADLRVADSLAGAAPGNAIEEWIPLTV